MFFPSTLPSWSPYLTECKDPWTCTLIIYLIFVIPKCNNLYFSGLNYICHFSAHLTNSSISPLLTRNTANCCANFEFTNHTYYIHMQIDMSNKQQGAQYQSLQYTTSHKLPLSKHASAITISCPQAKLKSNLPSCSKSHEFLGLGQVYTQIQLYQRLYWSSWRLT